jgi:cytochrome c oxidase cbb3-type subunit 2
MNRPAWILFGSLGVLLFTSIILVAAPFAQFKAIPPESGLVPYTIEQGQGREEYVSLGCVYCHSQQPRDRSFAPDDVRGWGRASSPGDYAYDYPHQLGTMRTGPDLFNIGARQPSLDWHLTHLYNPRAVVPGSLMPAYPFLFEEKAQAAPGDVVVKLPTGFAPEGKSVVARPQALHLIAYLMALDHTYPSELIEKEKPATAQNSRGGRP